MTDVAIFGASGYGGQELLRLLATHPQLNAAAVTSASRAGQRVEDVFPHLAGFYPDLVFRSPDDALPDSCAAAFLAVPHGAARDIAARLPDDLRVVDLSMDFRLQPSDFAYGLTETNREAVAAATRVANPGCFATGAILALAPLAERGLLRGHVTLAQTTGSSGSGAHAKPGTHHPERAQDMRAYKVATHQHQPEITQELERTGGRELDVLMVPQSGPFARGIFTVAHVELPDGSIGELDAGALYRERYLREPFVRVREGSPALRHVTRTNFCDVSVTVRGRRLVVLTAIDNLGKGMAGQALQNLNLMLGLGETTGLLAPGANL